MSSYYTRAELEAARKLRVKKELADSIQKLKVQLQTEHEYIPQMIYASNMKSSVFAKDDIEEPAEVCNSNAVIKTEMLYIKKRDEKLEHEDLDFSKLLFSKEKKTSRLELELDSWIHKFEERPIITESDEKDRRRLLCELSNIVDNHTIDIEDKINHVKMRVVSYLQGGSKVTAVDEARMKSNYFEYLTLCELLGMEPTAPPLYRLESEISRMTLLLENRKKDEYIMAVIKSIMEEMGCHVKDEVVLNHTIGQMYAVDDHPLCDIFVGNDGNGIMFEPVGESKNGSLEEKRKVENSANKICTFYSMLEERALEKGVILQRVHMKSVHIEKMVVKSDVIKQNNKRKKKKATVKRPRVLNREV